MPEIGQEARAERSVQIHDDHDHDQNHDKRTKGDCLNRIQDFLRTLVPKGTDVDTETSMHKKLEHNAYKRLLGNLENVDKKNSWDKVKITVHAALLAVFVLALVIVTSVPNVSANRVLHLGIPRWVALFLVAVSGLPCVQFVTYVVLEPLVWYRIRRTRMYTMYVRTKMKKSVDVTLWLLLVLGVWCTWFRPQIVKDTHGAKTLGIPISQYDEALKMAAKQVTRLLMALTLGAFLWTLKDALYVRINANLHYKEICPLIRRAILDYHAIQFIASDLEKRSWSLIADSDDDESKTKTKRFWMDVSYLNKKSTPIWILKHLCGVYRDHMMKRKPTILSELDSTHDEEKFYASANDLYENFRKGQNNVGITPGEIEDYRLKLGRKEMDFVFRMFSSQPQISEVDFQRWAVRALKGCLRLERILDSSRRLFRKLNMLMISCVIVLVIIVWLLISEIVTKTELALLFAPLVSASFIFGESLKRAFDGLIFVFGMHPFDVDQRVIIENVQMRVTRLRLLTTVFFVYETGDEVVYSNSVLATLSITKQDHTKNMPDSVDFTILVDTPEELISDLIIKIKKSLDDELTFTSDTEVARKGISETHITMVIHFKYLVPYNSAEIKARHRSKIFEKVVRFRQEMERIHKNVKALESRKAEYGADDSVELLIDESKMKLPEIEELKKNITEILQGCDSSKDCSKVLFTGKGEGKITITVHIRHRKDLLKASVKEDLKRKIQGLKDKYKDFLVHEDRSSGRH